MSTLKRIITRRWGAMKAPSLVWLALLLASSPQLLAADTHGTHLETWLGRLGNAVGIAGYPTSAGQHYLFVAGADGLVRPLVIGAPTWQWAWRNPIMRKHDDIVGLAAYYHPGDGRHHCFVALETGE